MKLICAPKRRCEKSRSHLLVRRISKFIADSRRTKKGKRKRKRKGKKVKSGDIVIFVFLTEWRKRRRDRYWRERGGGGSQIILLWFSMGLGAFVEARAFLCSAAAQL